MTVLPRRRLAALAALALLAGLAGPAAAQPRAGGTLTLVQGADRKSVV